MPRWALIGAPVLVLAIVASVLIVLNIGSAPNPAVAQVTCDPRDLTSCLIQPPAGAGKNSGAWAQSTATDATAYEAAYTDAASTQDPTQVGSQLTADGLTKVTHRAWTQGSNQIDLILLQFKTAQGAQAWADDRTGDFLALDGGQQIAVPGDGSAKAYAATAPDSAGDTDVRYVTTVGDIDLEAHYASQGSLQPQDFGIWAGTEYASLRTAPPVGPAPAPTPTDFQAATCPGALTTCLIPLPAGGQTVPGVPNTYTISSYASNFITKASAPAVVQRMQSDHVLAIDAESWGVNGFNSDAQVVLVQTRTDAQAQDLISYIGGDATYTSVLTIPGYPVAIGHYSPTADASSGFYGGLVTAQMGNVFMSIWLNFTGHFDTSTSQSWAVSELNLLTQDTQQHWGFPIPKVTAPTLPPFTPHPCTAAPLTDCLIPLPNGATAAGAAHPQDIGISGLISALYPKRQSYEQTWLTGDGAKDAVSYGWTASNGAAATDYVVRFGTARQAQAAAVQEAGDSSAGAQACSVPSLPNVYCEVLPADDSTGAVPIRVTAWSGPFEIDLEVTQTDSADTTDALTWAESQLEVVTGAH